MRIGPPRNDRERAEALRCFFGGRGADAADRAREAIALAEQGAIRLDGLIAAWSEDGPLAAGLSCLAADGSAYVWPPEVKGGIDAPDAIAAALLREIARSADEAGCPLAQSAVDPERHDHQQALEAAGFRRMTDLLYLQRPLDRALPAAQPPAGLVPFTEDAAARFAAVIEETYAESSDCPAFARCRPAEDALRSYRTIGDFTPERWRLLNEHDGDAAVILVNDRPDDRAREIVYLGVVPAARRRGLASRLVGIVLCEAARSGCDAVVVSVDAENAPALSLYRRLGFFPVARKSVYVRHRTV